MEFAELRSFLVVAEEGSFSRAAERLLRTQPAISLAVQRLEAQVGEPLFTRTHRRPELTAAGRVLLEYAGRLLALRDEAQASLSGLRAMGRGDVSVAVHQTLVGAVLDLVQALRTTDPDLRVEVRRARAKEIVRSTVSGEVDFGVTGFRPANDALEAISMGVDRLVVLLPAGHELAKRRGLRLPDLAGWPMIAHSTPSPFRASLASELAAQRVALNVALTVPTMDAAMEAVARGLGIALLPERIARAPVFAKRVASLPLDCVKTARQIWLLRSAGRPCSHGVGRLLHLARARQLEVASCR